MSMAGIGPAIVLWKLPYHTVMNLRNEYLAIIAPQPKEEETELVEIAPGVTIERRK
jgi:hypothetical protein